ncbi:MAG: hypothetical protein HC888_03085 [Candidatus Competibacteraceae bacterium]|nr:hypothetical protein [Candidatus Competibacteraceae bacterium]
MRVLPAAMLCSMLSLGGCSTFLDSETDYIHDIVLPRISAGYESVPRLFDHIPVKPQEARIWLNRSDMEVDYIVFFRLEWKKGDGDGGKVDLFGYDEAKDEEWIRSR